MRRIFSILFVLLFGLGPLAATLSSGDNPSLPACCRRLGAHHCAMASDSPSQSIRSDGHSLEFRAPQQCPLFALHGNASPSPIALLKRSPIAVLPLIGQTEASWSGSTSPDRIHLRTLALRGPPPSLLA